MDDKTRETIYAVLRAQVAEWTAEETERWFSRSGRTEGDLNRLLEDIDSLMSDLKERVAFDDKPQLHQIEANTVLDKLPHLKTSLSEFDVQEIAREVANAKVESLQNARDIILGRKSGWRRASSTTVVPVIAMPEQEVHLLSDMISKYQGGK